MGNRIGVGLRVAGLAALMALAGCGADSFFGEDDEVPLEGDRIAVMLQDDSLQADEALREVPVALPAPVRNPDWPQPGGSASKSNGHLAAADSLTRAWTVSIGDGSSDESALLAQPVIVGGRVFALDSEADLVALDATSGRRLWSKDLKPKRDREAVYAGGITAEADRIYAVTGFGEAMALSTADGSEIWRVRIPGPARGAPTVADGRLFLITLDNRSIALSTEDGSRLWEHQGITEVSSLLGGAAPAVSGSTTLTPYSSGEVFALQVENGRVAWIESLSSIRPLSAISRLSDIRGHPVIDGDRAFAVSHAGRMVAVDLRTGGRVWEQPVGGVHMPWVAGDFVFVVSLTGQVVALTRRDGRIRWVQQLPPFEDMEDREDPIRYAGPVLVGDRLLLGSSDGFVYAVSPYSGEILGRIEIGDPVYVGPLVANGTVYVLTDDGNLHAYR